MIEQNSLLLLNQAIASTPAPYLSKMRESNGISKPLLSEISQGNTA
jgi:hypothetical protein